MSGEAASRWFGISRQAYYQGQQRALRRAAQEQLVVERVQGIRQRHPRLGGRKLYHTLRSTLTGLDISYGRDRFFDLLRTRNLLVRVKRNRRRTTYPGRRRWPNRLEDLSIRYVHQVWVGDITYLTTAQGFLYLALLTDAYSRFIVGYDLSDSLSIAGCMRALDQALAATPPARRHGLIHHSDHGVQYTAWPYLERLQAAAILPSMGTVGNCYENARAERINGILKTEYRLDDLFVDAAHAHKAVHQAIWLYNYERPHLALNYHTPADFFFRSGSDEV